MRISANQHDRGYETYARLITTALHGGIHVMLDGKGVDGCVTADEEEGFVEVYSTRPSMGQLPSLDRLSGKVEVVVYGGRAA